MSDADSPCRVDGMVLTVPWEPDVSLTAVRVGWVEVEHHGPKIHLR